MRSTNRGGHGWTDARDVERVQDPAQVDSIAGGGEFVDQRLGSILSQQERILLEVGQQQGVEPVQVRQSADVAGIDQFLYQPLAQAVDVHCRPVTEMQDRLLEPGRATCVRAAPYHFAFGPLQGG